MKQDLKLLDHVALLKELPRERLRRGQVGAIVEVYGSGRYEVEFADDKGQTIALVTLPRSALLRLSYTGRKSRSRSKMVA